MVTKAVVLCSIVFDRESSVICVGVGRSEGAIRLHRSGYTNLVKRLVGPVNKLSYTHSSLIVALSHV
ncbi:hypothetical protein DPMN_077668 [Dreissena polymorpha]|uniref:Uncharacterized protein n=1 Tax=Dreissena polymorpha TaxID=45954 RepID=A0A9D3YR27_DREPO|nr:hypothetical protein DPMN_077668 [Dreissena polymorpha]